MDSTDKSQGQVAGVEAAAGGGLPSVLERPAGREAFEQRLIHAAQGLREAVDDLLDAVPVRAATPAEFQRVLKLDRNLSSRLLRAVRLHDPLACLNRLPGPSGIRVLLGAASKLAQTRDLVRPAEQALTVVEQLVLNELGEWKALEAAISGWLPGAREQFEMTNRQAAFRAMSNIKGVMVDVELSVTLIHPGSANPAWVDRASISALLRMKRLRPGAAMGLLLGSSIAPPPGTERLTLEGHSINPQHEAPLLREFCSNPMPKFDVQIKGDTLYFVLLGDGVGVDSMVDLLFADVMRGRYPANRSVSARPATPGAVIDVPVKTLIVDVLVHEDVWPGVEPELRMYDTAGRGIANPTDPARDMDRIDVQESILMMGTQISRFRTAEVERYPDMIRYVCEKLGWDSNRFRGYRCRVDYPVHGTQVNMIFDPPA